MGLSTTAERSLRLDTVPAAELSDQLRFGTGGHLEERRFVIACQLVATGCMGLIALYMRVRIAAA